MCSLDPRSALPLLSACFALEQLASAITMVLPGRIIVSGWLVGPMIADAAIVAIASRAAAGEPDQRIIDDCGNSQFASSDELAGSKNVDSVGDRG